MLGSEQEPTWCENSPAMTPGVCLMVGSDALFVIALSQVPLPGFAWHVFILPISFPWAVLAALFPFLLCWPACLLLYFMLTLTKVFTPLSSFASSSFYFHSLHICLDRPSSPHSFLSFLFPILKSWFLKMVTWRNSMLSVLSQIWPSNSVPRCISIYTSTSTEAF